MRTLPALVMAPDSLAGKRPAPGRAGQAALLALALALAAAGSAQAAAATGPGNGVHLRLDRVEHPQLSARALDLRLVPAIAAAVPALLTLSADELRLPALDQVLREVRFQCQPEPVPVDSDAGSTATAAPAPRQWQCRGPLHWRGGASGWQLAWQGDEAMQQLDLRLEHRRSRIRLQLPLAQGPLTVHGERVRAAWLALLLPQVDWREGSVDARFRMQAEPGRWQGTLRSSGLAGRMAQGAVEFAGVDLAGPAQFTVGADGRLQLQAEPVLGAGELLAGGVYLQWPAGSEVALTVRASQGQQDWSIEKMAIRDGGFQLDASARLRPGAEIWLQTLAASARFDLAQHYPRYLEGAMASLGLAGLDASGGLQLQLALAAGGSVAALDARFEQVTLADPGGRFRIAGLDGELGFRQADQAPADTSLRWRELALHALQFDPGSVRATSSRGELRSTGALSLGLFGGTLALADLVYRPLADSGDLLAASVTLSGIDLGRLTGAFGWPAFGGELDGVLPQLRYGEGRVGADGEIEIRAFDGAISVAGLAVERPFGVAPALSAQVRMDNLDLVPITEVFGFGRIEGRLDGSIADLRLVDWHPVAFDARLATRAKGRRRISQLAVDQLTRIGGAGAASGLQGRLLGAFDSFGYRRIGLSCRLANDVCTMGGVDEVAGGYTILQGSGLPLITIRGFQRQVDWPVLMSRLQAALGGQAPVVQ